MKQSEAHDISKISLYPDYVSHLNNSENLEMRKNQVCFKDFDLNFVGYK